MERIERGREHLSQFVRHRFLDLQILFFGLVFWLLAVSPAVQEEPYCYKKDAEKSFLFASITTYEYAQQQNKNPANAKTDCSPLQVWWLIRNGICYPDQRTILQLNQIYDKRNEVFSNAATRGQMCKDDVKGILSSNLSLKEDEDYDLTPQGEEELVMLGKRVRALFPDSFSQNYSPEHCTFLFTNSLNTISSILSFGQGLFGEQIDLSAAILSTNLIEPGDSCKAWKDSVETKPEEYTKLVQGPDGRAVIEAIRQRAGFTKLKFEGVRVMYEMCRYKYAWKTDKDYISPWCAVFTKDQLRFMEYLEDLRYYMESGYGNQMAVKLGCPLARDIFQRFQALAEGATDQPSGVFHFGSLVALLHLLSRLGFYRPDEPLNSTNMEQQKDRKWRLSLMAPFAANLCVIFYRCGDKSHHVSFLGNERPIRHERCIDDLCPWKTVRKELERIANQCDLSFCEGNETAQEHSTGAGPHARSLSLVFGLIWLFAVELMSLVLRMQ